MSKYSELYNQSIEDPIAFWKERAKLIQWYKEPKEILSQDSNGFFRWFQGGELNTSYLALDYHIEQGRGSELALIYDSPVSNTKKNYTYDDLRDEVALFAGVLKRHGLSKGDTVIIYMPMIPEAVIGMLACARLGVIHSVVFGGFAPHELAVRIDDCQPKLILTASYGIEIQKILHYKPMLDEAIHQANHKPSSVILFERPNIEDFMHTGRDFYWQEELKIASPVEPVPVQATDPLYVLYTSGTTGKPKGVIRDNGGHAVALKYSMQTIYDMKEGDVFWAASDVGWVVGHSYIVYAPLLLGCTTIVYEGKPVKTPDPGAFFRVIEEYKVKALFTAPTAFRAIKKEDPEGILKKKYDVSSLKYLFLAGERTDPPTLHWAENLLKVPIIDHWWQTETGYAIVGNVMGVEPIPYKPGSSTKPYFGFDVQILDEEGQILKANEQGNIAIKLPLPPGCLPSLWKDDENFKKSYLSQYEGYYLTGDGGYIDEEGYVFIMGRIDDVINVAGHRLSTGEMEEIIAKHKDVAECAVIGINDELKGQVPLAMVIIKDGTNASGSDIEKEIYQLIREEIGAIATLKSVLIVTRLPKTRSGKILRKTLRKMIDGEAYTAPSTIDDPSSLEEIQGMVVLRELGKFS